MDPDPTPQFLKKIVIRKIQKIVNIGIYKDFFFVYSSINVCLKFFLSIIKILFFSRFYKNYFKKYFGSLQSLSMRQ